MKANEFDKKIKGQVKKVEHTAPSYVTWDINKSWDKISQLLKQASPKSMVWYLSLAASVSMVMANVSLVDYEWKSQAPKPRMQSKLANLNTETPIVNTTENQSGHAQSDLYMVVNPKKVSAIPTITLAQTQADFIPLARYSSALQDASSRVSFKPLLATGITTSGARFSGELMVITNHRIKNASLGMSLEMSSQIINGIDREASASNQSRQTLYMNMVVLNDQARRPWTARIGTPLWQTNSGDSTAPMIKMNYQTKVGRRIYIGPEIIFTKAFKQVYPGISLSFG